MRDDVAVAVADVRPSQNVARGSVLGIVAQGWHLLTALLVYALLARWLGPVLFGRWNLALTVLAWFEIFIVAGVVRVSTMAITERPADVPALGRAAYLGQMLVALGVFLAAQVLAQPVAEALAHPQLAPLLRIAALDIPLYAAFMVASAVVLGEHRFNRQAAVWFVYATSKAALVIGFVLLGWGVAGALVGNALSSLVGFFAMFVVIGKTNIVFEEIWRLARWMMKASVPFLTLSLIDGFGQYVDLWLVSAIVRNGILVGLYASATVLAEIPVFLFLGLNRVIFPSVARARADGDGDKQRVYATQAVRLSIGVTILGVAFVAGMGRQLLHLIFSGSYVAATVPLILLMVAGSGRTIRATCTEVLLGQNKRTPALVNLTVSVAFEVVLVSVLAATAGLAGAAGGAAVSAIVGAIGAAFLLRKSLEPTLLATLARSIAASAVVAVALYYLSPPPIGVPIALIAGGLVYVVLLLVLGEFTRDDVATLRAVFGRG